MLVDLSYLFACNFKSLLLSVSRKKCFSFHRKNDTFLLIFKLGVKLKKIICINQHIQSKHTTQPARAEVSRYTEHSLCPWLFSKLTNSGMFHSDYQDPPAGQQQEDQYMNFYHICIKACSDNTPYTPFWTTVHWNAHRWQIKLHKTVFKYTCICSSYLHIFDLKPT